MPANVRMRSHGVKTRWVAPTPGICRRAAPGAARGTGKNNPPRAATESIGLHGQGAPLTQPTHSHKSRSTSLEVAMGAGKSFVQFDLERVLEPLLSNGGHRGLRRSRHPWGFFRQILHHEVPRLVEQKTSDHNQNGEDHAGGV